jgi:hypothetical protein
MRAAALAVALGVVLTAPAAAAGSPQVLRFDGGAYDRAGAITTDGAGNSYLAGSAESREGASPFVVVKLGPDGTRHWTARYDGSRGGVGGEARAVAVDAAGNVYAAGYIDDGVIFNQNYDYLVVKFGPDGRQRWAQRYNGPGNNSDFATQVVVDGAGNTIVTGFSYRHLVERLRVVRRHRHGHRHAQVRGRRGSRAASAQPAQCRRAVEQPDPAALAGQRRWSPLSDEALLAGFGTGDPPAPAREARRPALCRALPSDGLR